MYATFLLILLLMALGTAGWVLGVRWYYRLRTARPDRHQVLCPDGWRLCVHHRPAPVRRFREPVVLCHGLSANHLTFEFDPPHSVAWALAEAGFDTYSVDLRGYGASRSPPRGKRWVAVTIDDHIRQDAPALVEAALRSAGAQRAFWVGHSMGGLVGYAAAAAEQGKRFAGLVTLGAPVYFRYRPLLQLAVRLGAWGGRLWGFRHSVASLYFAPFLGHFPLPLSDIVVNPRHMGPRMMRQVYANLMSSVTGGTLLQFRDWILGNAFRSLDGKTDYREGLRALQVPLLFVGGSQDRLAPPEAVEEAYRLSTSPDKTLLLFGRDRGDQEEYGHADLVFGTGAPREVYPQLIEWLKARATPLDAHAEGDSERRAADPPASTAG